VEREARTGALAQMRKCEPLFVAPSSPSSLGPPLSRHVLARISMKRPLPVSVASSSFSFYTSAAEPPLQLDFPSQPQPYQHRHGAPAMALSPRHAHKLHQGQALATTATTARTATTSTAAVAGHYVSGSQTARASAPSFGGYGVDAAMAGPHSAANSPRHHAHLSFHSTWQPQVYNGAVDDDQVTDQQQTDANEEGARASHGPVAARSSVPGAHFHASLPSSPTPVRGMLASTGRYGQVASHHPPAATASTAPSSSAVTASAAAASSAISGASLIRLSTSLLVRSSYLSSLQIDTQPIFPAYHSYKATILKKKESVTVDVQRHAQRHAAAHSHTMLATHGAADGTLHRRLQ
jgi:hypothetical protein